LKKSYYSFLVFLAFSFCIHYKGSTQDNIVKKDTQIQTIVDKVNIDTIWTKLKYLQRQHRYTNDPGSLNTAKYIMNYMKTMGFDSVYFQSYSIQGNSFTSPNIIGIKLGKTNPDSIYIVCAHWDTYSLGAPGADDNGSGTVGVLEAARVLLKQDYNKTLKFCLFSGEELGLHGSIKFVQTSAKDKINAVLNLDMISYQDPSQNLRIGVFPKIDVFSKKNKSASLYNQLNKIQQLYVPGIEIGKENACNYPCTDIYSFWNAGFDGLFLFESSYFGEHETPYYHTSNDLLNSSANSKLKLDKTTKIVVACIASWAEICSEYLPDNNNIDEVHVIKPNPFDDLTLIKFKLKENSKITLKLTDIRTKNIITLIDNEYKYNGIYQIPIDNNTLEPGMYLLNYISNKECITLQIPIVK
jgi:hypothetical protein